MKILVTGGAGYIGSVLCEHLLDAGHDVTVIDSLLYRQSSLFHLCSDPRFEYVSGDVRDEGLVSRLVAQADALIPLAAVVGAPACDRDPWLARSVNADAVSMLNKLRSSNQLVVYPTTNSGYGATTGEVYCTEETPLEPISLYGHTKSQAESDLLETDNVITLRLATVFGVSSRMRLDLLVNHFVHAAVTDGYLVIYEKDFKRNYVHVRDVADCFVYCLEHPEQMTGRPFNLGLDEANLSKEQLALKIQEHVPSLNIQVSEFGSDPDKRNYIVSNQRLREAGFEAKRSLDDGIIELMKAYRMMAVGPFSNI
jgi:nucleoside-diphosphate-sugar epimerase